MGKKLLIDATHAEETRVVVLDGNKVEDFDFETIHKRQLAGNIYLAKVTRVEPSLQAAFVDYGGNRHGFLAFAEIHPDYYQIPVADRQALLAEERAMARAQDEDDTRRDEGRKEEGRRPREERGERRRGRGRSGRGGRENGDAEAPRIHDEAVEAEERVEGGLEEVEEISGPEDITEAGTGVVPFDALEGDSENGKSRAESAGLNDARAVSGMDIVDLDEEGDTGPAPAAESGAESAGESRGEDDPRHFRASEIDSDIESVADEDVSDEVSPSRRPRAKRYKIQEVIKVRQIMLVQVVKEERGNKGAALTTYLSLAGRYCVLMPNTGRGGGISRKITNVADRKKLKEIAAEMEVPEGAGLIIRTAGANRTRPEIKRDYEYLFRLWEQIRDLTLKSVAPAQIYEEGDLVKRSIRDLYNKDIDEVLVEGEGGYTAARDFMRMIMPSHAKNVKLYNEQMPLFARHQVEGYLAGMFNPTVQLKSGGYIVIGVTEALVAIDINSGRATRQGSIEETALQTNLEAADEIARQLRLRDLAGLIVIDFIDMEERRNNAAVEKRMKDALRNDRARIQVGRISGFGLLEMSRQRLRPGMLEATTQPCQHCHGTGLIRSDNSIALAILRALEEEGVRNRSKEVLVRAPVGVVNYFFNQKREHLAQIEARYGMAIRIEADPALISPDYHLEKFKTATRVVRNAPPVISLDAQTMSGVDEDLAGSEPELDEIDETEVESETVTSAAPAREEGENGRKKRRRRRRRGGEGRGENGGENGAENAGEVQAAEPASEEAPAGEEPAPAGDVTEAQAPAEVEAEAEAAPARKRRTRTRKAAAPVEGSAEPVAVTPAEVTEEPADAPAEAEAKPAKAPRRRRKPAKEAEAAVSEATATETTEADSAPAAEAPAEPVLAEAVTEEPATPPEATTEAPPAPDASDVEGETDVAVLAPTEAPAEAEVVAEPAADPEAPARPRRAGWWSRKG